MSVHLGNSQQLRREWHHKRLPVGVAVPARPNVIVAKLARRRGYVASRQSSTRSMPLVVIVTRARRPDSSEPTASMSTRRALLSLPIVSVLANARLVRRAMLDYSLVAIPVPELMLGLHYP